jgi:hypothetical protein
MSDAPPPTPVHGGNHPIHGIFLGENPVEDDWISVGCYRYASHQRGDKHVAKVEKNSVSAQDSVSILKFHGTLKGAESAVNGLDKDQFVRGIKQTVREHGQQSL